VALREMDDLNQDFPDVHLVRANVLARLNRAQEAAGEFKRFLQQAPEDRAANKSEGSWPESPTWRRHRFPAIISSRPIR